MTKKIRSDKAKNIAKVAAARAKNPLWSTREIGKEVWLDNKSVSRLDKELPQIATKTDDPKINKTITTINEIISKDLEIVDLWVRILRQRLEVAEWDSKAMSTRDVISATDVSAKRYSLFKWNATNDEGGLDIKSLSEEELLKLALLK